jgi:hypothetical protein
MKNSQVLLSKSIGDDFLGIQVSHENNMAFSEYGNE